MMDDDVIKEIKDVYNLVRTSTLFLMIVIGGSTIAVLLMIMVNGG